MTLCGASRAARCGGVVLLVALAPGCRRAPPTGLIGYAFPSAQTSAVRVARDALAEWKATSPAIGVYPDSSAAGSSPDRAVARAQRMAAAPGVVVVVGHDGSRASLAAAPVYNDAGVAQIVPTGTTRLLRLAGPWTFPVADDDSIEGALLAEFSVRRLHARGITIFYHNDEYGLGLRDGVQAGLKGFGVPVLDEVRYDANSDLDPLVEASLMRAPVSVIVVAGRQHETARIARLVTARWPGTAIVAGDGALVLPALANEAGAAIGAIYVAAFWLPDSSVRSRAFVSRYRRVTGQYPDPLAAMTHDALMLAATAIRTVGADRRAVRDYLASLGQTRPPYAGITGPIEFGRDRPVRTVMARIVDGHAVRVDP